MRDVHGAKSDEVPEFKKILETERAKTMNKTATLTCRHCKIKITCTDEFNHNWSEMLRTVIFRRDMHELGHFAKGDDLFSNMERKLTERRME